MGRIKYTKGQVVGEVIFIKRIDSPTNNQKAEFKCQRCDNEFTSNINNVKRLKTKSCGCLNRIALNKTHNETRTSMYYLWQKIKQRCYSTSSKKDYANYGGRGISVYAPWINNYQMFRDYVKLNLGERPDKYSLDRIDNDGNYEPNNIRWASFTTQNNNRRPFKVKEII